MLKGTKAAESLYIVFLDYLKKSISNYNTSNCVWEWGMDTHTHIEKSDWWKNGKESDYVSIVG